MSCGPVLLPVFRRGGASSCPLVRQLTSCTTRACAAAFPEAGTRVQRGACIPISTYCRSCLSTSAAQSMPLVRVRILHGKTQLAAPSRPFAADVTLQHVVGKALEPFADYAVNVLEVFPTADEVPMKKSEFYPDDFESITLDQIKAMGFFWVALVRRADGFSTTLVCPSSSPNSRRTRKTEPRSLQGCKAIQGMQTHLACSRGESRERVCGAGQGKCEPRGDRPLVRAPLGGAQAVKPVGEG